MTEALSPAQAVAYVRELSADVRAVAVLDAAGTALAGPPGFTAAAADLVAAWPRVDAASTPAADAAVPAADVPAPAADAPRPTSAAGARASGTDVPGPASSAGARASETGVSGPPADELVARTDGGVVFAARSSAHAVVAAAGPLSLVGPTALDVRAALAALTGTPTPADGTPPALANVADPALRRAISALTTAR